MLGSPNFNQSIPTLSPTDTDHLTILIQRKRPKSDPLSERRRRGAGARVRSGDLLGRPVEAAEVRVAVEDPGAADKVAKIELFEDGKMVESHEQADGGGRWTVNRKAAPGSHHYFDKVTQTEGNLLWSAPVWLEVVSWN